MKKNNGLSRILYLIIILLILAGLFTGFRFIASRRAQEETSESIADIRAEKGVPVKVAKVEALPWQVWKRYYGQVRASRTQDVTSFVREFIVGVPVDVGNKVNPGDVLLELSTETQAYDLSARVADYQEAKRDYERKLALSRAGGISKQEVEKAYVTMQQKSSLVRDVQTKVSRTKVYAKIDGTVTYRDSEVGEIAESGKKLMTVADTENLEVEVLLPPLEIGRIVKGTSVRVRLQGKNHTEAHIFKGEVLRINPEADPSTGLYKCIVQLSPGTGFTLGSYVETEFLIDSRESVIQIPYEIIKREDSRTFVYVIEVIETQRAFKRYVQPGEGMDSMIEIVNGLAAGETVVVDGMDDVFDGAKIWIQE